VVEQVGPVISRFGIDDLGLAPPAKLYWNLTTPVLVDMAVRHNEARLVTTGGASVNTARAP